MFGSDVGVVLFFLAWRCGGSTVCTVLWYVDTFGGCGVNKTGTLLCPVPVPVEDAVLWYTTTTTVCTNCVSYVLCSARWVRVSAACPLQVAVVYCTLLYVRPRMAGYGTVGWGRCTVQYTPESSGANYARGSRSLVTHLFHSQRHQLALYRASTVYSTHSALLCSARLYRVPQ